MTYFNKPADLAPMTKARSVDLNNLATLINAAFGKLPLEATIKGGIVNYTVDTGNAPNAYVVALPAAITALVDGLAVEFRSTRVNTGPATLNVNGLGAVPLKRREGSDLKVDDIRANIPVSARYSQPLNAFIIQKGDSITLTEANELLTIGARPELIPITRFNKGTLAPLQTIRVNAAGTDLEGAPSAGISTATATVTDNITLAAISQYVPVQMAARGKSITLPPANQMAVGGPYIIIDNSKGNFQTGVRNNAGALVGVVGSGGVAALVIKDASNAAGVWAITGTNLEPGMIVADAMLGETGYPASGGVNFGLSNPWVALDDNVSLHFVMTSSSTAAAFVIDNEYKTVSTPVVINANANEHVKDVFKIDANRALVIFVISGNVRAVVVTVQGTATKTVAPGTVVTLAMGLNTQDPFLEGPAIAQLSSAVYALTMQNGTAIYFGSITVTGNVVAFSPLSNFAFSTTSPTFAYVFALSETMAVVFHWYSGNPYARIITVDPTGAAAPSMSGFNGFNIVTVSAAAAAPFSVQQIAPTKFVVVWSDNSQNGFVGVITATTAGVVNATGGDRVANSQLLSNTGSANQYLASENVSRSLPRIRGLSNGTHFYVHVTDTSGMGRISVHSWSGTNVINRISDIAGSYKAGGATNSDGHMGAGFDTEFIAFQANHGNDNYRQYRAVPHKVSTTAGVYTVGMPVLLTGIPMFNPGVIYSARLPQGDYIALANLSTEVNVMRLNGDEIMRRGSIPVPAMGIANQQRVRQVAPNRIVLMGYTIGVNGTYGRHRFITLEIAQ